MGVTLVDCAKEGSSQAVRQCLLAGASPDMKDAYGETALNWAAHLGHTAVVKDLLAAGAGCEVVGNLFSAAPLILAARGGHRGVVALLAVHANPDARDPFGASALMLAVEKYEPVLKPHHRIIAIVNTLLSAGASVNAQDDNGDTPLMWAIRWKNREAVELLLQHGANIHHVNHRGWSALEMADARGDQDLVELLKSHSVG